MKKTIPAVSAQYKKEAKNSVIFIVFFFIVYLLLILISLGVVAGLGFLGIAALSFKLGYFTILISAGIIGMGVFILIFLFKFIFSSNRQSNEGLIEINKEQEPELFELIYEVVNTVETQRPKKVFLTTDVNAFVNYDSTFWSMFFPVKKNLTIGLGLINTTTVSEIKAILAHEFGHFSQKTMKVGSYVNQANKIIYDMLYKNEGMDKMMSGFAKFHAILYYFARLAMFYLDGVKWILGKMYDFLYLKHMSLSRQMEFNADAIAAYVAGSEASSSSLLRLDLSEAALNNSLNFYLDKDNNADTTNLYENQTVLLNYYAEENNHAIENNLPKINEHELERYNKSKLKIEDQWSSHPTIEQRIKEIRKLDFENPNPDNRLAKSLIKNFDTYAQKFTKEIFGFNDFKRSGNFINNGEFLLMFKNKQTQNTFNKVFNSYYNTKNPVLHNYENLTEYGDFVESNELFSDEKVALAFERTALEADLNLLKMIQNKTYKIKSYDYDGQRYTAEQSSKVIKIVEERIAAVNNDIENFDKEIFTYLYAKSDSDQKEKLFKFQNNFNTADVEFDKYFEAYNKFVPYLDFMSKTLQFDEIRKHRAKLLEEEKNFKNEIAKLTSSSNLSPYISKDEFTIFNNYLSANNIYFNNDEYLETEIGDLNTVLITYQQALSQSYFKIKKEFLDFKADILSKTA